MNSLACLHGRPTRVVSATILVCAIAGCAGQPSHIVSRSPASSQAGQRQQHTGQIDQIDRKAMTEQRQTLQEGRMTRYGAFQPLFFGDDL